MHHANRSLNALGCYHHPLEDVWRIPLFILPMAVAFEIVAPRLAFVSAFVAGWVVAGLGMAYLVYRLATVLLSVDHTVTNAQLAPPPTTAQGYDWGSTSAVGWNLFNEYLFPFEAVSILLLVAVVGAIAIARPLKDDQTAALKQQLRARAGREVTIDAQVNPDILGGIVVKLGSQMIDASIRTKLNRLAQAMKG